jgi:hypothetical protein
MKKTALFAAALVCASALGCATATTVRLPPDTKLTLLKTGAVYSSGPVVSKPFFWDSIRGIEYTLVDTKDAKIVQTGRLPASFRPVSIFWPPFAIIYWPTGFAWPCYDLTKDQPLACF